MSKVKFSDNEVAKIADLIKISIPESELGKYGNQLETVLDAVPVLQELDTADVAVTAQTHGLVSVLREDEPEDSLDMSKYKNTQNFNGTNFIVKKVL